MRLLATPAAQGSWLCCAAQVELVVIKGDVGESSFGQYGKIVFELFYRVDLATMG